VVCEYLNKLIDLLQGSESTWWGLIDRNSTVVLCEHQNKLIWIASCSSTDGRWKYFLTAPIRMLVMASTSQHRRSSFMIHGYHYQEFNIITFQWCSKTTKLQDQDQNHLFFQDQDRLGQDPDQDHFFKTKTAFLKTIKLLTKTTWLGGV